MGVNKLYNAYQAGKQIAKTVTSPITHAKNIIKSTFTKTKKPKIGGTKKADKIKEAVGIKKKVEKLEKQRKKSVMAGKGLYANIHAKRKRGGKMRKKGAKGAPKASDFKRAKQTVRKK